MKYSHRERWDEHGNAVDLDLGPGDVIVFDGGREMPWFATWNYMDKAHYPMRPLTAEQEKHYLVRGRRLIGVSKHGVAAVAAYFGHYAPRIALIAPDGRELAEDFYGAFGRRDSLKWWEVEA